ncbi:MAG: hypothetical protein OYL92_10285 [Acidobacteriota bacterium]|nr:hypothetical protein [Acidobacteriota bacterium]MDE3265347.1 hypothetical protein [Acidobacteriota bacterium]
MAKTYEEAAKSLAHLLKDTRVKLLGVSNSDANREQLAGYLYMVEVEIALMKKNHLDGGLTEGGYERGILGKWSAKP